MFKSAVHENYVLYWNENIQRFNKSESLFGSTEQEIHGISTANDARTFLKMLNNPVEKEIVIKIAILYLKNPCNT